jgi:hypothetical protein
LRFSDEQILKDMENDTGYRVLYLVRGKHTPGPLKRELEV